MNSSIPLLGLLLLYFFGYSLFIFWQDVPSDGSAVVVAESPRGRRKCWKYTPIASWRAVPRPGELLLPHLCNKAGKCLMICAEKIKSQRKRTRKSSRKNETPHQRRDKTHHKPSSSLRGGPYALLSRWPVCSIRCCYSEGSILVPEICYIWRCHLHRGEETKGKDTSNTKVISREMWKAQKMWTRYIK